MALNPVVEVSHAFGSVCGQLRREAVAFGDEVGDYLVNPVGRRIAFRRIDTNEMNVVIESEHVESVTACAISRSRGHLAVCETCISEPLTQVSVYDLRAVGTKPAQTLEELGGAVGRIVCASFSPEESANLLCFASAGPDCLLVVLDWRQNRVHAKCSLASPADQVALSPLDPAGVVSASGENFINVWTVQEGLLQASAPFSGLEEPYSVTDHAWVQPGNGMLTACTSDGAVHILHSKDSSTFFTIRSPFELVTAGGERLIPECIRCYQNGFIVGSSQGSIAIWEMADDVDATEELFTHVRTLCVRRANASICCIDTVDTDDPSQMKVVFGFSDALIGHTSMSTLKKGLEDMSMCSIVAGGFHSGPITSLDVAAQRPIIASMCQQDSSVRIWNYALRRCELCVSFPGEELTGVAIHPFGFLLAVSFSDKLRFFQILHTELKPYRELSNGYRGIRLVKFSNGGHLLAIAQGKLVLVVNTKTLQRVATLRGHSQHVTSLSFDPQDQMLLTCGEDGSLFEWSVAGWQKANEHFARSSECLSITAGRDGYSCCSLTEGSRCMLQLKDPSLENEEMELEGEMQIGALCSQTGLEGTPVVLAGTSTGMLWICQSPLSLESCDMHGLHTGACTVICIAADGCTVVTAGADGAIFVLSISGIAPEMENVRRAASDDRGTGVTEIVMINRGEIQVRLEEFQLLEAENNTLEARLTEEASKLEGECKARVEKARKKDQEEITSLRKAYETLQSTATHKERENLRELKTIEANHVQAADQVFGIYDKKITSEADRYLQVEATLKTLEKRIEILREDSDAQLEQVRLGLQEDLQRQVAEKETEIQKLKDLLAFSQHRFDTMLDQEGMEYDYEIAEMRRQSQEEFEQQQMVEYQLKKEQDTLLRGLDKMEHDREQISKEQMETKMTIKGLTKDTTELEKNVNAMKGDRHEREVLLRERELQIGAHKVKVNTLKKFKHVLDFRLREVTESLKPKDTMIEHLNADLINLEAEFEKQLAMQHQMESSFQATEAEVTQLLTDNEKLCETIKHRDRQVGRFHADLYKLVNEEQDVRLWPPAMKRIYRDHMNPECIAKDAENAIPIEELRRQTKVMERKVSQLAANKATTEDRCTTDIQKQTTENSLLIHELDMLRVDKKTLHRQVKDLLLRVRQAEYKIALTPQLEDQSAPEPPATALSSSPSDPGIPQLQDLFSRLPDASGLPPAETRRPLSGKSLSATRRAAAAPSRTTWQHAGGDKMVRPVSHVAPQDRRKIQQLLVKADLNQQQIEMQAVENKILRDQVHKLTSTVGSPGGTLGGSHVAGAAHRAARLGSR